MAGFLRAHFFRNKYRARWCWQRKLLGSKGSSTHFHTTNLGTPPEAMPIATARRALMQERTQISKAPTDVIARCVVGGVDGRQDGHC
jgi:hypothetical protein